MIDPGAWAQATLVSILSGVKGARNDAKALIRRSQVHHLFGITRIGGVRRGMPLCPANASLVASLAVLEHLKTSEAILRRILL